MATIKIPAQLRSETEGKDSIELPGNNVREVIDNLVNQYSNLRDRIYDKEGNIKRYVNIYLGEEDIRFLDGLETKIDNNAELILVPAIAGGSSYIHFHF